MADVVVELLPWGRKTEATWTTAFGSLFLVVCCPIFVVHNWIALEYYGGSLASASTAAMQDGVLSFLANHAPQPTKAAVLGYAAWLLFQAFLYGYLPGPTSYGQMTPGGNLLKYCTNGLLAWAVTHVLYVTASLMGLLDPAIIAKNWEGLLVTVNVYGIALAVLCQIKAYVAPSHASDRKFSGTFVPAECAAPLTGV